MDLSKYLNFIEVLNYYLKKTPGYLNLIEPFEVDDTDSIEFHQETEPKGASFNLVYPNLSDKKQYYGAIEVEYYNDNPVILLRLDTFCVVYDGQYGYINKIKPLAVSSVYEYTVIKNHFKYADDLDSTTAFQYKLVEDNIDNIVILMDLLREMVNTDKYDAILKAPFREKPNV